MLMRLGLMKTKDIVGVLELHMWPRGPMHIMPEKYSIHASVVSATLKALWADGNKSQVRPTCTKTKTSRQSDMCKRRKCKRRKLKTTGWQSILYVYVLLKHMKPESHMTDCPHPWLMNDLPHHESVTHT